MYFISVADCIDLPNGLPANYYTNNGFQDIICSHESHSSILEIKKNVYYTENVFSCTHVNQSDVRKIIESLNTRKAHGFDGMPAKLLNSLRLFWQVNYHVSQMTPLIIKNNYGPVSIPIVLSKVYDRVMANQLLTYFDIIFWPLLSAFWKKNGCQSTLLTMVQHFKNCIDNDECVGCMEMDLSKAFESLAHRLTICKLRAYGASQSACTL